MSDSPKNSNATTNLLANQEDEPHEGPSAARSQPNTIAVARKQFNDVIQFQEPSTSKSYSFKTEIRINIVEEPSQHSFNDEDSTLTLFRGETSEAKREALSEEESFMTTDTCLKEKGTATVETVLFSRNERTQRAVLRGQSEAPPPYTSLPPPPYMFHEPPAQSPYYSHPTNTQYNQDLMVYNGVYPENEWMIISEYLRRSFTRKVLFTVGLQLSMSTAMVACSMFHPTMKFFVNEHIWMSVVCMVGFTSTLLLLGCVPPCRKVFPWNYFLLLIHTFSLSYALAMVAASYPTNAVLIATAGLSGISFLMALAAFQTLCEVISPSVISCLGMIILFGFGFALLVMQALNRVIMFDLIWSGLTVLVLSVFLLLDLQMLLRGKRHEFAPDDYICATAVIFTDVLLIFVYFGEMICKSRRRRS
ncbi:protein lifeguard 1-like isoform X1 [Anthonomus grandis grandis]|uniref:protein lifeguard 1-like isoform X1 n=1 Tax=Anthonomus grandis grandis TaxID=2921223 RepID=UPI0021664C21|nr:protein lifeguard 1-like isoform X1 [Anthonomus grandis grandis]